MLALLRAHNDGLRYGLADVEALDDRTGPPRLDRLALDLRSRFTHETRGARAGAAPDEALAPRADEGAGMIVVSIVVASFDAIPDVELLDRPSSFVALSADFGDAVPALEVIWSPSEPDDRMSSHELEKFYPELRRLNDAGDVGSMTCPHCGAPRPAELDFCPRCGSETRR